MIWKRYGISVLITQRKKWMTYCPKLGLVQFYRGHDPSAGTWGWDFTRMR